MGVALEVGKLSAVAALPTLRQGQLKAALVAVVAVLMGLNTIGAYGFLAKAQADDLAVSGHAADLDARISVQADKVADLNRQIADLDAARTIEAPATSNLRTAATINARAAALAAAAKPRAADDERRQAKPLPGLKTAAVEGERRTVEADLGPVQYLATLLGADNETVLRGSFSWLRCCSTHAPVLLLLAATSTDRAGGARRVCERAVERAVPFGVVTHGRGSYRLRAGI
jgi:hypothetical protein